MKQSFFEGEEKSIRCAETIAAGGSVGVQKLTPEMTVSSDSDIAANRH